jgi:hypothetical protein
VLVKFPVLKHSVKKVYWGCVTRLHAVLILETDVNFTLNKFSAKESHSWYPSARKLKGPPQLYILGMVLGKVLTLEQKTLWYEKISLR